MRALIVFACLAVFVSARPGGWGGLGYGGLGYGGLGWGGLGHGAAIVAVAPKHNQWGDVGPSGVVTGHGASGPSGVVTGAGAAGPSGVVNGHGAVGPAGQHNGAGWVGVGALHGAGAWGGVGAWGHGDDGQWHGEGLLESGALGPVGHGHW